MKIKDIQFIGKPPYVNGFVVSLKLQVDEKAGVMAITLDGDTVRVRLASGSELLIPSSAIYITTEPEAHTSTAKGQKK